MMPHEWPDDAPSIKTQLVTLIAKNGRDLAWATSITDKRLLVRSTKGPLWAVWTGEYSSHLFTIPRKQAIDELGLT